MGDCAERQAKALEEFSASGNDLIYGWNWGIPERNAAYQWLPDHVPSLLEIGAGGGRWTVELAKRCDRLYVCEGTKASLKVINRQFPEINIKRFMVCPNGYIPLADASIHFVASFESFVHFEPEIVRSYFQSVGRVLTEGGMFLVQYAKKWPGLEHGFTHYYEDEWILGLASECGLVRAKDPIAHKQGFGKQTELFMVPPF